MKIKISKDGTLSMVYSEEVELQGLGDVKIKRASHVEPEEDGKWSVDLSPVGGEKVFGFNKRSEALKYEHEYIENIL